MINEKKISKSGGLTIPSHLRRELGINPGDRFEIVPGADGDITLTRTIGSCIVCKSKDELLQVGRVYICRGCGVEISNKIREAE